MTQTRVLVTGGAGFLGSHLVGFLLEKTDVGIVIFDKLEESSGLRNNRITYCRGDVSSREDVRSVFETYGPFTTVYHLASAMPNKAVSDATLWKTNVMGTEHIALGAAEQGVRSLVFTSSNVTYGIPEVLPTTEETPVCPLEIYGRSKVAAEKILATFKGRMNIQIIRCPVISGIGRLGLQAILFEFISEDKNVYVLGDGSNRYQFADVMDVCDALERASHVEGFDLYNIGADEILSLKELYQKVIIVAGSKSKIVSIPRAPALFALSILDRLHISPLGVYQYTMIGRSLYTDTAKMRSRLNWKPKKTNADASIENYRWYLAHKGEFVEIGSQTASDNRSLPKMGVLKLLKMLS